MRPVRQKYKVTKGLVTGTVLGEASKLKIISTIVREWYDGLGSFGMAFQNGATKW